MTYNVFGGTLNPTLLPLLPYVSRQDLVNMLVLVLVKMPPRHSKQLSRL